jgi:hypothetical protein
MSGWLILFALLLIGGAAAAQHGAASAKLASTMFAILFLIAVTARAARGRTW